MTDKEKEAIERLHQAQIDIGYATLYSQEEQDVDIQTVLNLVKKQQEEIEKKDRELKEIYNKIAKEYNIAIEGFMKKNIPTSVGDGEVAQALSWVLGLIENKVEGSK